MDRVIGEMIFRMRKQRRWSQDALAAKSFVSRPQISRIERGENTSVETLTSVLRVFGCTIAIVPVEDKKEEGDA